MPINTGIQLLDAILNNPIQSMIVFTILYFIFKAENDRDFRVQIFGIYHGWHYTLWHIWYRIAYRKEYSYTGVDQELMDEIYALIKQCGTQPSWYFEDFIKAKLGLSKIVIYQNIRALMDLGKLSRARTSEGIPYYVIGKQITKESII